jgi:hypothetical protein
VEAASTCIFRSFHSPAQHPGRKEQELKAETGNGTSEPVTAVIATS